MTNPTTSTRSPLRSAALGLAILAVLAPALLAAAQTARAANGAPRVSPEASSF